jgi:DNA-binding MarR family transcriptional regulator
LTPKEISQILRVENSTISGVLDRMEKRGLVNRVLDPNDRRSIRVEVSEKGLKIKNGVQKMIEDLNDVVLQDFSAKERKELLDLLSRVGHVTTDE